MPAGAAVGAAAAGAAFLRAQQARPIEPADGEPPPCHPDAFGDRLAFVVDEAQRGDGQGMVEAGVGKRQRAGVALDPIQRRDGVRTGEVEPVTLGVEAGGLQMVRRGAAGEPAGAAADVEQRFTRPGGEVRAASTYSVSPIQRPREVVYQAS